MTIRSALLASALILSAAVPASAAGDNVVLITAGKVDVPSKLPGLCRLNGTVSQVWEGKTFHPGQPLVLNVPCSAGNPFMTPANTGPSNGVHFIAVDVLLKAKQGMAHIDDAGNLIWQSTGRSYGMLGVASGYRVLDGVEMPARPHPFNP